MTPKKYDLPESYLKDLELIGLALMWLLLDDVTNLAEAYTVLTFCRKFMKDTIKVEYNDGTPQEQIARVQAGIEQMLAEDTIVRPQLDNRSLAEIYAAAIKARQKQ